MKATGWRSMQAAELFWSSIITIRSLAGSLLHGDRSGLARRARRLHKSRGTIEYFGSSIANGCMAEDSAKIPRSSSPEERWRAVLRSSPDEEAIFGVVPEM